MERTIFEQLGKWKQDVHRKPLLVFGARQVGKTWALKEFGKRAFERLAYFSLDEEPAIADVFKKTKDPHRIVEQLSYLIGIQIKPQTTLIVLDEIQECPEALAALKYFCEAAPEYAVAAAGSLLGIAVGHEGMSFPVGKVDHLDMFPLTFSEFLLARDKGLYDYFQSVDSAEPLPQIFFDRLSEAFTAYRICGGMPEAILAMLEGDNTRVESVLKFILTDYSLDFVKHTTPTLANRVAYVWRSLPSQLARENRKFVYQLVRPGARARECEDALLWLLNAGITYQVHLCREPRLPLSAYDDLSVFKVYCNDVGLLRSLANMSGNLYTMPGDQFREFKGALAENYVLQSLVPQFGRDCRFWSSGNQAEIEFLIDTGTTVIPIEVKSGENVRGKSLQQYVKTYTPNLSVRFSMLNLRLDGHLLNMPLFMADRLGDFLKRYSGSLTP